MQTGVQASFSADNRWLALVSGEELRVFHIDAGPSGTLLAATPSFTRQGVDTITWSTRGALMAITAPKGESDVWDIERDRSLLRHGRAKVAFSADGASYATLNKDGALTLYGTDSWAIKRTMKVPAGSEPIAFAPRGPWLEAGRSVFNVSSGESLLIPTDGDSSAAAFWISGPPSGKPWLVVPRKSDRTRTPFLVTGWDLSTEPPRATLSEAVDSMSSLNPLGDREILGDGTTVRRLRDGLEIDVVHGRVGEFFEPTSDTVKELCYRAGDDPLASPVLCGNELASILQRRGIVEEALAGKPVPLAYATTGKFRCTATPSSRVTRVQCGPWAAP